MADLLLTLAASLGCNEIKRGQFGESGTNCIFAHAAVVSYALDRGVTATSLGIVAMAEHEENELL